MQYCSSTVEYSTLHAQMNTRPDTTAHIFHNTSDWRDYTCFNTIRSCSYYSLHSMSYASTHTHVTLITTGFFPHKQTYTTHYVIKWQLYTRIRSRLQNDIYILVYIVRNLDYKTSAAKRTYIHCSPTRLQNGNYRPIHSYRVYSLDYKTPAAYSTYIHCSPTRLQNGKYIHPHRAVSYTHLDVYKRQG